MSRGLGRIEREVLSVVEENPRIDVFALTCIVFGLLDEDGRPLPHLITASQKVSVRRALSTLRRKGLVFSMGRSFYDVRSPSRDRVVTAFAGRDAALAYVTDVAGAFGAAALQEHPDLMALFVESRRTSAG